MFMDSEIIYKEIGKLVKKERKKRNNPRKISRTY